MKIADLEVETFHRKEGEYLLTYDELKASGDPLAEAIHLRSIVDDVTSRLIEKTESESDYRSDFYNAAYALEKTITLLQEQVKTVERYASSAFMMDDIETYAQAGRDLDGLKAVQTQVEALKALATKLETY